MGSGNSGSPHYARVRWKCPVLVPPRSDRRILFTTNVAAPFRQLVEKPECSCPESRCTVRRISAREVYRSSFTRPKHAVHPESTDVKKEAFRLVSRGYGLRYPVPRRQEGRLRGKSWWSPDLAEHPSAKLQGVAARLGGPAPPLQPPSERE